MLETVESRRSGGHGTEGAFKPLRSHLQLRTWNWEVRHVHSSILYFNQQMLTKYGKDPSVTAIVNKMDWVIMPVFNVDGYEYSHTKVGLVFIFGTGFLFLPATVQY